MAHRAFAAFAARALALGVPAIAFAAFAAAFAFAWGFSASALPPLAPMRLRYCLMDSSTEPAIYYLAANKQSEPFREERCLPIGIWGRWIVPEKAETRLESGARILERRYWAHTETENCAISVTVVPSLARKYLPAYSAVGYQGNLQATDSEPLSMQIP